MNEDIFRKKSLDKMKSPESLNDYVRVSNPGVWLLLVSVIILLIGACVWSIFGTIESTLNAEASVRDGVTICYVSEKNLNRVRPGMDVYIDDADGTLCAIGEKSKKGYVCTIEMEEDLPDGTYSAEIVTEKVKPISFVLN